MIYLDPGHPNQSTEEGSRGFGAAYEDGEVDLLEHELTLEVARKVYEIGNKRGAALTLTREDESPVSLSERVEMANADQRTEGFISLHFNWFRTEEARGSTIFHYPDSPEGDRLADCLDRYFRGYARIPHRRTRITDTERDDDLKPYLYVLSNTECPAVLLELLFLSNPEDRAVILEDRDLFTSEYAKVILGGMRHWQLTRPKKKDQTVHDSKSS